MKFSTLSSLSLLLSAAAALPQEIASRNQNLNLQPKEQNDGSITIGPAPYDDLMTAVYSHKQAFATASLTGETACHGLMFCEDNNLKGSCYWGCYESNKIITPDRYWRARISSLMPDQRSACYVTSVYRPGNWVTSIWKYPGGTLKPPQNDNIQYFECKPK